MMNKCDCGAEKCKTTHSAWCSTLAPVVQPNIISLTSIVFPLYTGKPEDQTGICQFTLTRSLMGGYANAYHFISLLDLDEAVNIAKTNGWTVGRVTNVMERGYLIKTVTFHN